MSTHSSDTPLPIKIIIGIIGLFLVIVVIAFVIKFIMTREPVTTVAKTANVVSTQTEHTLQKEFRVYMITRATERVGQPIEGFDADIFMLAFPGLVPNDFDAVETLEGHYVYEDNKLTFIRETESFGSTAEQTISERGYVTLLSNITRRLKVNLSQRDALEEVYVRID
jgi:hypothetical protein